MVLHRYQPFQWPLNPRQQIEFLATQNHQILLLEEYRHQGILDVHNRSLN